MMAQSLAGRFLDSDRLPFPFPETWFVEQWPVAQVLRDRWDAICRETIRNGRIDELHAARDDIQAVFDRYIALFKDYVALLDLIERTTDRNGPLPHLRERISRETEELTLLYDEIFPKWQSVDDVAEMILAKHSLTQAELKIIAAANRPAQSWYEETIDPFAGE
jgi:hypothetical protein